MKRAALLLVPLLCLWLAALPVARADEEDQPAPMPTPASQPPVDPQEVLQRLSEIRGLSVKDDVSVQFTSPRQVRPASAQMGARRELRDVASRTQTLFRLLGLIPQDGDLSTTTAQQVGDQIGGSYDLTDRTVQIFSNENDQAGPNEIRLVRQYMHALEHQNFRVDRKFRRIVGDSEAVLGLQSLAEGDTIFTSQAYRNYAQNPADLSRLSLQVESFGAMPRDRASGILEAILMFPYTQGAQFVAELYKTGGWEAVNNAYNNPPRSAEQILHPKRYLAGDEPKPVQIPDITQTMGGWTVEDSGVFGELTFMYYLSAGLGPDVGTKAAKGWGGDKYLLLKNTATGRHALIELSTWDRVKDANEFVAGVSDTLTWRAGMQKTVDTPEKSRWTSSDRAWYVAQNGSDVLLVTAPDDTAVKSIVRRVPGFRP